MMIKRDTMKNLYTLFKSFPKSVYNLTTNWEGDKILKVDIYSLLLKEEYKITYGFEDSIINRGKYASMIECFKKGESGLLDKITSNHDLILTALSDFALMNINFKFYDADLAGEELDGNDVLLINYLSMQNRYDQILYKVLDGHMFATLSINATEKF